MNAAPGRGRNDADHDRPDDAPHRYGLRRLTPEDDPLPVLDLIRRSFAAMEGRIRPGSSVNRMTAETLMAQAVTAEVWVLLDGARPVATMTLTQRESSLYIGKLAVADDLRGQGLARQLVRHADQRATALGLKELELQTRVELTENQALFAHLGFREVERTAHPGFAHPTSITFRKPVPDLRDRS